MSAKKRCKGGHELVSKAAELSFWAAELSSYVMNGGVAGTHAVLEMSVVIADNSSPWAIGFAPWC